MPKQQTGFALVFILAMLVLLLAVVLAVFSRAIQERQIRTSITGSLQADSLANVAMETVLTDLRHELRAGSEPDPLENLDVSLLRPLLIPTPDAESFYAPSMVPQPSGVNDHRLLVKASRRNTPVFAGGPGYRESGSIRASPASTEDAGLDGRHVGRIRWMAPRFLLEAEEAAWSAPDWIYMNRTGSTVVVDSDSDFQRLANPDVDNGDRVVGRYAYAIYDLGGLWDINVVGNRLGPGDFPSDVPDNRERGFLHQISLGDGIPLPDGTGAIEFGNFDDLVGWRWPGSGNSDRDGYRDAIFDPSRSFLDIREGDQAILSRRDLILMSQTSGLLPEQALPFLTVFSRDSNRPSHAPQPDPLGERRIPDGSSGDSHDYFGPGDTPQAELDPDLLGPTVRFTEDVVILRPDGPVLAPAGTPVVSRRFPLHKLDLLSEADPDPDALRYYFGLRRLSNSRFEYVERIPDQNDVLKLGSLESVANHRLDDGLVPDPENPDRSLPAVRDPNFFELIQAVVLAGSLGKSAGSPLFNAEGIPGFGDLDYDNTSVLAHVQDHQRNKQVLQIGANIIDQWDSDDIPTMIRYPSGDPQVPDDPDDPRNFWKVYGVENLPYLSTYTLAAHRPDYPLAARYGEPAGTDGKDFLQVWACFDVWNPHQNATRPEGIEAFRIVGSGFVQGGRLEYQFRTAQGAYDPLQYFGVIPERRSDAFLDSAGYPEEVLNTQPHGGTRADLTPSPWNVGGLNENFELEFRFPVEDPSGQNYGEPTALWGPDQGPESEEDVPGVLLMHLDLRGATGSSAGIPPKEERHPALQRTVNFLFDRHDFAPYTATAPDGTVLRTLDPGGNSVPTSEGLVIERHDEQGDRIYPFETTFGAAINVVRHDRRAWIVERPEPTAEEPEPEVRVYANPATKAQNWGRLFLDPHDPVNFSLEALIDGEWRPYQTVEGWFVNSLTFGDTSAARSFDDIMNPLVDPHHSDLQADLQFPDFYQHYGWRQALERDGRNAVDVSNKLSLKADPRSGRFGWSYSSRQQPGEFLRSTAEISGLDSWVEATSRAIGRNYIRSGWGAYVATNPPVNAPGFEVFHTNDSRSAVGGLIANNPDLPLSESNPLRYADIDGVIRPADGAWGALPTVPGQVADRPKILNRPFRSVGELGYVFRDSPWRTIDFSTPQSGDAGLLDVFAIGVPPGRNPTVAGRFNLNRANPEVLAELLREAVRSEGSYLSSEEAASIANAIAAEREVGAFSTMGDLVARGVFQAALGGPGHGSLSPENRRKTEREAAIRALSGVGMLGTWNLFIDLIVQSGGFVPTSASPADFAVRGEQRIWVHLAMDRFTGEVVDMKVERVDE